MKVFVCQSAHWVVWHFTLSRFLWNALNATEPHKTVCTGGLLTWVYKQEVAAFLSQQMKQQEEVEKKAEVAMEMSDLVVYCQPRSKEKDRFGKHTQTVHKVTQRRFFSNMGRVVYLVLVET